MNWARSANQGHPATMLALLVASAAFNAPTMGSSFVALSSRVSTPVMQRGKTVPFWEKDDWQAKQAATASKQQGVGVMGPYARQDGRPATTTYAPYTLMTIQPTFTVKDWTLAAPIMEKFVAATKTETGCIYYGWSKVDDKLFCREAYTDAAAVLAHLDNVGALVGEMLEAAATLDGIELHGPPSEMDKCKATMDGFGTTYWAIDSGITFITKEVGSQGSHSARLPTASSAQSPLTARHRVLLPATWHCVLLLRSVAPHLSRARMITSNRRRSATAMRRLSCRHRTPRWAAG